MSAKILPKGRRVGLFASRKIKTNHLASSWIGGSGSRCRWSSSNASPAKNAAHGKAPAGGWTTLRVLGLAAATGIAAHYAATKAAESRRVRERAYSNPVKLGGQPVYASIKEMEAVSKPLTSRCATTLDTEIS
jgi:hypothetical protein